MVLLFGFVLKRRLALTADDDNPTVYCELMKGWVGYVQAHLARVTPPSLWRPRHPLPDT